MSRAMSREDVIEAIRQTLGRDLTLAALSGWIREWHQRQGFKVAWDIVPEKLMLIVTELAEAMEAYREKDDAAVVHFEEEMADVAIRLFDLCGGLGIDLRRAVAAKMEKNFLRPYRHGKRM